MSWFGPDVTIHEERSSLEILWDAYSLQQLFVGSSCLNAFTLLSSYPFTQKYSVLEDFEETFDAVMTDVALEETSIVTVPYSPSTGMDPASRDE
ncbi:hypothetical protein CK203_108475 [Vitis vinifera]|uniref:Uncharacterized protein n=1 Tax=Vitis vinifera TaxID=29760 RepID=A0A438E8P0_VITVI|nr:hypothetical protein CK203_108475 [Vitis vinifera]